MGIDQRSGVLRRILPVLLHLFVYTEIATAVAQISDVAHCRLDIVVDPASSRVSGIMDISAAPGRELTIYPNSARITELHIAGGKTDICKVQNKDEIVLHATGPIRLRYETIVTTSEDNLMSDGEIVLKYGWYPVVDGFCSYEVHAALPPGYTAVSEGETAETTQKGNQSLFFSRFDRPYPDAISLVAFKNVVVTRDVLDDIDIYAYFLKEDAVHANVRPESHGVVVYEIALTDCALVGVSEDYVMEVGSGMSGRCRRQPNLDGVEVLEGIPPE